MVSKTKACRKCKALYEGDKCPNCESSEGIEGWKGKAVIINPEQSEIAKKINITKPGTYAIKTR